MAVVGAGAEIMDKVGAENKYRAATLISFSYMYNRMSYVKFSTKEGKLL